tara:strand:- start:170 stop:346 length:177 start_codon:yes stop_codon:yes gene_type:complete
MKVLKETSRKYKDKKYYKYKINIPGKILEDAELKEGDELIAIPRKEKILLKKTTKIVG